MNKESINYIKSNLNIKKIEATLKLVLGYNVQLHEKYGDTYVELYENVSDGVTTRFLTSTPLTRCMFKEASIYMYVNEDMNNNLIYLNVHISYTHPSGGCNGIELFIMTYDVKNDIVVVK